MWRRSALIGWSCRPFAPVPVSIRQFIALGSLVNALVALYLHLWKLGLMGSLACSSGG